MTSAPAIGFEYQPSRLLARALTAVLALAVLAIASCGFAWWLKPALVILALGLWLHAMRHRSDADVTAAGWAAEGGWNLHRGNGDDAMATLLSFRVLGNFVLLRLRERAAHEVAHGRRELFGREVGERVGDGVHSLHPSQSLHGSG